MTAKSSPTITAAPSDLTTPVDSQGSHGDGLSTALIVSLTIVALAIVAFSAAVAVWWCRRHRRSSEGEYRTVTDSFFEVRID
jgi:amino acid transporter